MTPLTTVEAVFDALGGREAIRELTGAKRTAVGNWLAAGRFPAHTYVVLTRELSRKDYKAPVQLWGMTLPGKHAPYARQSKRA